MKKVDSVQYHAILNFIILAKEFLFEKKSIQITKRIISNVDSIIKLEKSNSRSLDKTPLIEDTNRKNNENSQK
jgi:hypothetical protein